MTKTFTTRIALDADDRDAIIAALNVDLATALDLFTQVKQAHWNIKGPQFFARHLLFDDLAAHLSGHIDKLAERATTLGGYARGTARCAVEASIIDEYDLDAVDGRSHIRALVERYAAYASHLRNDIELMEKKNDLVSQDLIIEVLRSVELDLWFLESHINV